MTRGYEAATENQRKAGKPVTRPQPKGRGVPQVNADPLAVLHTLEPEEDERIKYRDSHRLTPVSKAFICECILTGYTNRQINALLRRKGFILEGENDLSDETLRRARSLPECALDLNQLTQQARQVGHNVISSLTLHWVELGTLAFQRLNELRDGTAPLEGMSAPVAISIVVNATRFLMNTYGLGLAERLQADADAARSQDRGVRTIPGGTVPIPPAEQLTAYCEAILAASYERCRLNAAQEMGLTLEECPLPPWNA